MSEQLDPSPRASKRRRTTTPSSTTRTGISSTKKTSQPEGPTPARKTPLRVSSRLKTAAEPKEFVDSAYASKDDSLLEGELEGEISAVSGRDTNTRTTTLQSAESIEIPETPGEITGATTAVAKRKTPGSTPAAAKSGSRQSGAGSKRKTRPAGSVEAKNKADSTQKRRTDQGEGQWVSAQPVDPEIEIEESQDELHEDGDPVAARVGSTRSRRRPRRYSIESQSTRDQSYAPSDSRKGTASAAASPQPKGILTPSKGRRNGQRKSVLFESGDKEIEEQLGFKDIDTSSKKARRSARATEVVTHLAEVEDEDVEMEEIEAVTAAPADDDPLLDFDQPLDILASLEPVDAVIPSEMTPDSPVLKSIKAKVLGRLTSAEPSPPAPHLASQQAALTNLLTSTVVEGESNSLLLLGPRGAGKTLLLDHVLSELKSQHTDLFHIVRLNGFFQTDDRVALREIWRQLGRETQDEGSDENAMAPISYADTLASLLSLLSHPEEMDIDTDIEPDVDADEPSKTAKSVVIVLDEFDLFTLHPRQTLLYNLFDIAQSRKAPIAVIGCSTRMDVVESLEKRVKSRFSHRWLHVPTVRTLAEMKDVVESALVVPLSPDTNLAADHQSAYIKEATRWNEHIQKTLLPSDSITQLVSQTYHTTKSISSTFSALYTSIANLTLSNDAGIATTTKPDTPLQYSTDPQQHSLLSLLPVLPTLHLALLAALSSPSYPSPLPSFTITHTHYLHLLTRTRLAHSSSRARTTGAAASLRQWGRELCLGAWEDLLRWGVLVRQGAGRDAAGKAGGAVDEWEGTGCEVVAEEVLWALKTMEGKSAGVGAAEAGVLVGWVRGEVS